MAGSQRNSFRPRPLARGALGFAIALGGALFGCREAPSPEVSPERTVPSARNARRESPPVKGGSTSPPKETTATSSRPPQGARAESASVPSTPPREHNDPDDQPADSAARMLADVPPMRVDDARAAAAGLRKVEGRRLTLYTDLPSSPEIDSLPAAFDQAFAQWCALFGVAPAEHADWRVLGFLMGQKTKFQQAGALPADLPPFQHAYARNREFWLYEQPSDYYRRHLVLHEGTHCFMNTLLGACGPPWYMEGVAELLATHRWQDGRLQLNYFPKDRNEVPMLGRIKIVQEGFAAGRAMSLRGVLNYGPRAHLRTEPYAWCWALCAILDRHPRYRDRFHRLHAHVLESDFTDRFLQSLGDDREHLAEEWQVFVAGMEYGYDVARSAIDFAPGRPLPPEGTKIEVAADRGWQNSGVRLEADRTYRLRAAGRYQVALGAKPWPCEPGGVTIRYYQGRPLGVLLVAVHPDGPPPSPSVFLKPTVVGLGTDLTPSQSGTLFFKINDSAAELDDNRGAATVEVVPP
ncbi:MAG: hypothetical protein JW809_15655 [Pirellulales bacterium]|nr:hypothetical protein [Pirellulales bacterium]